MGLKVLILAGRKTGYEAIRHILDLKKHTVVGVFSKSYENMVNDGISPQDYASLLSGSGVDFWQTDKIHSGKYVDIIKRLSPDIGLSIGWRRLVGEPVVSIPPKGFINFHTSDLPRYRGFASTSWAILNGDEHIALSAHKMISNMADSGNIFLKKIIPIMPSTDIGTLFKEIESIIPGMVEELLDKIESGTIKEIPQDEARSVSSFPRHPSDGWIDWSRPAEEIDRLVRSVSRPYPGAFTCWDKKKMIVWKGYPLEERPSFVGVPGHVIGPHDESSIKVLTGDGIYVISEIQPEDGDDTIPPAKLIKGVQQRLGLTLGELYETYRSLSKRRERP